MQAIMKFHRATLAFAFTALTGLCLASTHAAPTATIQKVSTAETPKAYRMDAARYIYASYPDRIYKGKLPPLVHAIVVAEVVVDGAGGVKHINMIRVPTHAPDVTASVQKMIHAASPLPAPSRMGGATFTEIWLVDKSGRFQLDALTEGQR